MTRLVLVFAIASAALGYPASAEPLDIRVSTRGLDLASIEGRAALDQRIRRVATDACTTPGQRPVAEVLTTRRCVAAALDSARVQFADRDAPLRAPAP
jgi:UrcA family protein